MVFVEEIEAFVVGIVVSIEELGAFVGVAEVFVGEIEVFIEEFVVFVKAT